MRAVPSLLFTFLAVNDQEEEAEDDVLLSAPVSSHTSALCCLCFFRFNLLFFV